MIASGALVFAAACSSDDDADPNATGSGASTGSGSGGTDQTSGGTSSGSGGSTGSGTGGTIGLGGDGAGGALDPIFNPDGAALCGGEPCQCSNGIDDDGDGDVDGFDIECQGAADNDESSFATGIPGDNKDRKQDCFFDGNSGQGNDGCDYNWGCVTGEVDQSDPSCQLTDQCIEYCSARTPNGCDCFGCCSIIVDGEEINVQTAATCSDELLDDEEACPRCVKSEQCGNDCGECELCPGKTADDLPADCGPSGGGGAGGDDPPGYTCDNGATPCSDSQPCEGSYYCQLGCCMPSIR